MVMSSLMHFTLLTSYTTVLNGVLLQIEQSFYLFMYFFKVC